MNPLKTRRKRSSNADRKRATDLLPSATDDLKALMDRANQMSEETDLQLGEVLEVLDEIGKAATRLANLLKAEQELTSGGDLGLEIHQALKELFGHRAFFHPEGSGGTQGQEAVPPA